MCSVVKYQVKLCKNREPHGMQGRLFYFALILLFGSLALKGFNSLLKTPQQYCWIVIMTLLLFFYFNSLLRTNLDGWNSTLILQIFSTYTPKPSGAKARRVSSIWDNFGSGICIILIHYRWHVQFCLSHPGYPSSCFSIL